jgi:hypothetical protein
MISAGFLVLVVAEAFGDTNHAVNVYWSEF